MALRSSSSSSNPNNNNKRMCSLGSIDEAKRIFDRYDINGDGKISSQELRVALDSFGTNATTSEETERIISEIDRDGDGHIDFGEFLEFFRTDHPEGDGTGGGGDSQSLRDAFDYYDLDKNGLISATELHSVLRKLGEKCSLGDCRRMISSVDKDGDGNVDFEEFKEMMTRSSS